VGHEPEFEVFHGDLLDFYGGGAENTGPVNADFFTYAKDYLGVETQLFVNKVEMLNNYSLFGEQSSAYGFYYLMVLVKGQFKVDIQMKCMTGKEIVWVEIKNIAGALVDSVIVVCEFQPRKQSLNQG
jgi:hypothetical protein